MAAKSVQTGEDHDEAQLNTTINTTPLIDVMLVMLIIFIITIPVIVQMRHVDLPNARNIATVTKPENIVVTVDKTENVYWNNAPVDYNQLRTKFVDSLRRAKTPTALPEVHIRGDARVRFQAVGRVVLACQEAGVPKVGFITEPRNTAD
jgi:biopolymer transport protein ExbD